MLTNTLINASPSMQAADVVGDASLGNRMLRIAGIIGIATKNGYEYAFPRWINQQYFINSLPYRLFFPPKVRIPPTLMGYDFGFRGFDFPDDIDLEGEFGSWKYWEHCEDLIRHYFTFDNLCEPFRDTIIVHYRDYKGNQGWADLGPEYYTNAIAEFPGKRVIVVTDNTDKARRVLGDKYEYTSNTPIIDLFLLCHSDYLVMANSTFSWWAGILTSGQVVAPAKWYGPALKYAPTEDLYYPKWKVI
jgi:hypothetical protein